MVSSQDEYEWDAAKNEANIVKHGIDFVRAVQIFEGPVQRFEDDRQDYGEVRYRIVGAVDGVELTVIGTERGEAMRIISARRARRDERRDYRAAFPG